jgi:hypothetical protein
VVRRLVDPYLIGMSNPISIACQCFPRPNSISSTINLLQECLRGGASENYRFGTIHSLYSV